MLALPDNLKLQFKLNKYNKLYSGSCSVTALQQDRKKINICIGICVCLCINIKAISIGHIVNSKI